MKRPAANSSRRPARLRMTELSQMPARVRPLPTVRSSASAPPHLLFSRAASSGNGYDGPGQGCHQPVGGVASQQFVQPGEPRGAGTSAARAYGKRVGLRFTPQMSAQAEGAPGRTGANTRLSRRSASPPGPIPASRPELQDVLVQLELPVRPGVHHSPRVHPDGAVPDPAADLRQTKPPARLARPLDQTSPRR